MMLIPPPATRLQCYKTTNALVRRGTDSNLDIILAAILNGRQCIAKQFLRGVGG